MFATSMVGIVALYFMFNSKFMSSAPPVPTCGKVKESMIEDVAKIITKRKNQLVMDLGSGWGTLLLPLAKKFPNHHFVGIEYGYIPYYISKFRARKMKNVTFYRQNFFKADITKANVILLFLLPKVMSKLKIKLQSEAKRGAFICSNRFPLPDVHVTRKINLGSEYNTYYIYKNG